MAHLDLTCVLRMKHAVLLIAGVFLRENDLSMARMSTEGFVSWHAPPWKTPILRQSNETLQQLLTKKNQ